jgi:hypothetical protein
MMTRALLLAANAIVPLIVVASSCPGEAARGDSAPPPLTTAPVADEQGATGAPGCPPRDLHDSDQASLDLIADEGHSGGCEAPGNDTAVAAPGATPMGSAAIRGVGE